jgi:xanthine dehydrogenase accessory factor
MGETLPYVLIRGGGDLGSGVVLRLVHCGIPVVVTEIEQPLSVRRLVCFSEAIPEGRMVIEGVEAVHCQSSEQALTLAYKGAVPVLVDPEVEMARSNPPAIWVDARMRKRKPERGMEAAPLVIGLGPGFSAGEDCHAAVETNRGPHLGRVYWQGSTESDTGIPEKVYEYREERVLRAPVSGELICMKNIGDMVTTGMALAEVRQLTVYALFNGVIRGLMRSGVQVERGQKIGDVDPRGDIQLCRQVSDKALAIAGGVLEAILSRPDIRLNLFSAEKP